MADDNDIDDNKLNADANADAGDDVESDLDQLPSKKISGKKLVLFIVLPLVLLIGGGVGLYSAGFLDGLFGKDTEAVEHAGADDYHMDDSDEPGSFYDMPDMIVNLNASDRKQRFLKLSIALEVAEETDVAAVEAVLPRVTDHFQTYLRELRIEDLEGSAGIYRMRQELLERVRTAIYPAQVRDVLFKEILVQ